MVTDRNIHEDFYQETDIKPKNKHKQKEHDSKRQVNININQMIHLKRDYGGPTCDKLFQSFSGKVFQKKPDGNAKWNGKEFGGLV